MKPFRYVSPSQINTKRQCARKWWFEKVFGVVVPSTPQQAAGTACHKEIEDYLATWDESKLGPVTRQGLLAGVLPKKGDGALVEFPIGEDTRAGQKRPPLVSIAGIPVVGFIDVLKPGVVEDHKTTSDFKWAKTAEELTKDPQMLIYAAAAMALEGEHPIEVAHVVYRRTPNSPAHPRRTPAVITPELLKEKWPALERDVLEMKALALQEDVRKVPPNWSACGAFGGCPHKDRCQALKGTNNMGLLDQMKAANTPTPDAVDRTIQKVDGPAPVASTPAGGILARIKAAQNVGGSIVPPDVPNTAGVAAAVTKAAETPAPVAAPVASGRTRRPRGYETKMAALGWDLACIKAATIESSIDVIDNGLTPKTHAMTPEGVVYKMGPVTTQAPVSSGSQEKVWDLDSQEAADKIIAMGWDQETFDAMTDEAVLLVLQHDVSAADYEPTKNEAGEIVDFEKKAPPASAPVVPVTRARKAPEDKSALADAQRGTTTIETATERAQGRIPLVLFINCRPVKGFADDVQDLTELLAPMQALVAADQKVPYYGMLDYGKGPSLVAGVLMSNLPTGAVYVDTRSPCSAAALDVLLPIASLVVRGV